MTETANDVTPVYAASAGTYFRGRGDFLLGKGQLKGAAFLETYFSDRDATDNLI